MLKFKVFGYPVEVEGSFLFIMVIFGSSFLQNNHIAGFLEVSVILFLSILVHELGHALAFKKYKVNSRIVLHGMGGLCIPLSGYLKPKENMIVCLCGPFAGFVLALVYYLLNTAGVFPETALSPQYRDYIFYFVNIGWGIFNLLPIYPLDGGQSLHNFLMWSNVKSSLSKALKVSIFFLILIGGYALYLGQIFIIVLCAWLLYENIQKWGTMKTVA